MVHIGLTQKQAIQRTSRATMSITIVFIYLMVALVSPKNTPAEWQEFKDSVGSEWIGSEIQELKIVALSPSAVSIKAQWINRRENAPSFVSCDSYIAAKTSEGAWIFTNYLVVDCDSLTREWR